MIDQQQHLQVSSASEGINGAANGSIERVPCIELRELSMHRRTQEELSYDLKRNIFAVLEGRYHKPALKTVLSNINLTVTSGEKVGIVGPNGSGKSTLLKIISGILRPTAGAVRVQGAIAPLIELGAGFDPDLTVLDNVVLYGILLGFEKEAMVKKAPEILAFAELEEYAAMPVKTLSSGMHARLGFAVASDVEPDILILDEVLSIGDEYFRRKCKERIARFWDQNVTVLLVSHELSLIESLCERVICMDHGRIAFDGKAKTAVRFYLDTVDEAERHRGVE